MGRHGGGIRFDVTTVSVDGRLLDHDVDRRIIEKERHVMEQGV